MINRSRSLRSPLTMTLAIVGMASAALVAMQIASAAPRVQDAADEEPTLKEHMTAIGDEMRNAFRAVGDPATRDDALSAISKIQEHLVAAKSMTPPGTEAKPESEQDAWTMDFRKRLAEVLGEVAALEVDVIEGRTEEATTRIREKLIIMRNDAHEIFQVDD